MGIQPFIITNPFILKDTSNTKLKKVPLSDQQAIVRTLDKVAAVIRMRNAELKKLDNLIKTRFYELGCLLDV